MGYMPLRAIDHALAMRTIVTQRDAAFLSASTLTTSVHCPLLIHLHHSLGDSKLAHFRCLLGSLRLFLHRFPFSRSNLPASLPPSLPHFLPFPSTSFHPCIPPRRYAMFATATRSLLLVAVLLLACIYHGAKAHHCAVGMDEVYSQAGPAVFPVGLSSPYLFLSGGLTTVASDVGKQIRQMSFQIAPRSRGQSTFASPSTTPRPD